MNHKEDNVKLNVGLWRHEAIKASGESSLMKGKIFPSGRQVITSILKKQGLKRSDFFVIPQWSSHCVISAIGKVAMPVVVPNNLSGVQGVLVYEQWGWLIPEIYQEEINIKYRKKIIILDRVDTVISDDQNYSKIAKDTNIFEVYSLSKMLGLKSGGVGKRNGAYMEFVGNNGHKDLASKLFFSSKDSEVINFYKGDIEWLHPDLSRWLKNNSITTAIEKEKIKRLKNLEILYRSPFCKTLPQWMKLTFKKKACPGMAPLFINESPAKLLKIKKEILNNFNLAVEIYHFNCSGNPLKPNFRQCIAFPLHGEVANSEYILSYLNKHF